MLSLLIIPVHSSIMHIAKSLYSSLFRIRRNIQDLEDYTPKLRKNLPGPEIYDSQELIDAIRNIDDVSEEYKGKYEAFYDKYCNLGHGNSAKDVIDIIFKDVGK